MDIDYLLFLQQLRESTGGIFSIFFHFITNLSFSILVLAFVYWCLDKKSGMYMMFNYSIGFWINGLIKLTACVYRPWVRSAKIKPETSVYATATGYSFPSGHSAIGTAVWGSLAVANRKNKWFCNICILLVLLIGFSRNYFGVHTPQDVIVSILIGIILLWLTKILIEWLNINEKRKIYVLFASILMCVGIILYTNLKNYPIDYVNGVLLVDPYKMKLDIFYVGGDILGFGIGYFCEQKWLRFSTDISNARKILRFLVGGLIYLFLFYIWKRALNTVLPKNFIYLIGGFMLNFFIIFIYPLCFETVQKKCK